MIPTPDWNRIRPHPLPAPAGQGGGCSDAPGCVLGCGGTLAVAILTLAAWKVYGLWAGLAALAVLLVIAGRLTRAPRIVPGLLLGTLAGTGVWMSMRRDDGNHPGRMAVSALLVFLPFALAGWWDQKHRR